MASYGSSISFVSENEGVAKIKPEFILEKHERKLSVNYLTEEDKRKVFMFDESEEPPSKKVKLKGQNKERPITYRQSNENCLCPILIHVADGEEEPTCENPKCPFIHDIKRYIQKKPADIGSTCVIFEKRGKCPRGITCRYGSAHISSEGRNIVKEKLWKKFQTNGECFHNILEKELQSALRKREYDFQKAEKVVEYYSKQSGSEVESNGVSFGNEKKFKKGKPRTLGNITDEEIIRIRPSEKTEIDWNDKLYLSPLTTVGNLPFRRICKEFGADITCGEMSMASTILQGTNSEWALVRRHESEDLFGVQICGNNAHVMTRCAQLLAEKTKIDFIDINLGCPIENVYRSGAGSGLLRREKVLGTIVKSISNVISIPLTVKTRTGISDKSVAHTLVPKLRDWGVSMVTIHGRSREQRYTRVANWSYVNDCASLAAPMPVFGNGDVLSYEDYEAAKQNYSSISGIMIGRGALIKPWIFTEIKEKKLYDIRSTERLDILKKYVNYGLEQWGSDTVGVEKTRRFLLEWLSFLHRYIPVGLLEHPPQKINERPAFYQGRDDLETQMASSNCGDWIKISEILLGKVPDDFIFLPKHKASSWK